MLHNEFTDADGGDFLLEGIKYLPRHIVNKLILCSNRNGTLFACLLNARKNLGAVKRLPGAVTLYYCYRNLLYFLIGRKPLSAACAFSSAADGSSVLRWT